jgi:hypothetical protein
MRKLILSAIFAFSIFQISASQKLEQYLEDGFGLEMEENHIYVVLTPWGCQGDGCGRELRDWIGRSNLHPDQMTLIITYDNEKCIPQIFDKVLSQSRFPILIDDRDLGWARSIHSNSDNLYETLGPGQYVSESFSFATFSFLAERLKINYTGKLKGYKGFHLLAKYEYLKSIDQLISYSTSVTNICEKETKTICNRFVRSISKSTPLEDILLNNVACQCLYEASKQFESQQTKVISLR